jgi:hypothetical protein
MDQLSQAIAEWQGFYAAVAGVGATLVGLVYVGVTIHLGRHELDNRTRLLGTMSGINLLYPVLAALVMLMPLRITAIAGGLLLVALFGIGGSISIAISEVRKPEGQTRHLIIYRYFVALLASGALGVGALALLTGQPWGIYAPPIFAFVMLAIGCDNAWDLLLSRYGKRSFIDIKTPPAPPS